MADIACMPLVKYTDAPLFGQPPGTLSGLQNMDLKAGGYAEARGGFEKMRPSGGTAPGLASGSHQAVMQLVTSYGWVRTYDSAAAVNSQYSVNRQLSQGGYQGFPTGAVNDAIYWGSDERFSRIAVSLSVAATWGATTIVYEYWNGAAWSALTTAETITWTVTPALQYASWTLPTDWAAVAVGDTGTGSVLKFWMRIRISVGGGAGGPTVRTVIGFWSGMKEIYSTRHIPRTSAANGLLARYGQTGTTGEWFSVGSSLFSGSGSVARMVQYRGVVVVVNGKETKRWDGANFKDLGISAHADTVNITPQAGGVLGAGIWRYYVAYGEGPCQNFDAYADRQDASPLYGPGQARLVVPAAGADPADANSILTAAAQRVRIEQNTTLVTVGVSAVYIYRTRDLTNVAIADRGNMPAFLIQSLRVNTSVGGVAVFETGFGVLGNYYYDDNKAEAFPQVEAFNYDISPPSRCTSAAVFQNRLVLADAETIYWSDPSLPKGHAIDRFPQKSTTAFMRLSKAAGGRNMGISEFGDQIVAFTETQVWGIGNVDLDIPQLYPIDLDAGCCAPDSISVGDGRLIWLSPHGMKMWDGTRNGPKVVSGDLDTSYFFKPSYENWGFSRGVIHNGKYDFVKASNAMTTSASGKRYTFETGRWSDIAPTGFTSNLLPLAAVYAPLGNNDVGVKHPIWGRTDYATVGVDSELYLGELTTQDNGTNYTCLGTMHFPLKPSETFKPARVLCYYKAQGDFGWGTPTLASAVTSPLGSAIGTLNAGTPDLADDYNLIGGTFSQASSGSSDIKVTFSVLSASGGAINSQWFFGGILQGEPGRFRRGGI